MNSMTGFGKVTIRGKAATYNVEISSVNNRYLEITTRIPRQFSVMEHKIKEMLSKELQRGKVLVYVGFEETADRLTRTAINVKAAKIAVKQLRQLKKELDLAGDVEISDLVSIPEVVQPDDPDPDKDIVWAEMSRGIKKAMVEMVKMRKSEGSAMAKDMKARLTLIEKSMKQIAKEAPVIVDRYRSRLHARLDDLLGKQAVDPGRIEQEIALFAERSDFSEECTRLASHVAQFRKTISIKDAIGKRLNFILQEMNREANTVASKCNDNSVASQVISMKEEIEKLREMVQNVE